MQVRLCDRVALRLPGCSVVRLLGCAAARQIVLARGCGSAPPETGRGATTPINQAFCKAPCMAKIRATMIELLSA